MASLSALAKSYRAKRDEVAKLRREREKKLKAALSQKRRSNSGLVSLERKKEEIIRNRDHVAQTLNQYLAQKDSIERLRIAAEERLRHEQDAQDEAKQQSEFGGPEEKVAASQRLKIIDDKIAELRAEIKEREGAGSRILGQIEHFHKEKSKIDGKLKNQIHAKPGLQEQLKSSSKAEAHLRPRVQSLLKREAQTSKALQSIVKKLAILEAVRRKAARRKAARKRAAARARLQAKRRRLARKIAILKAKLQARRRMLARKKTRPKKTAKRKTRSRTKKSLKRRVAKKIKSRVRKTKRRVTKRKARRSKSKRRK
ncbi:MAG: hypothetical protein ACREA3_08200 [Nitrosotalea sp.]